MTRCCLSVGRPAERFARAVRAAVLAAAESLRARRVAMRRRVARPEKDPIVPRELA
jgi:hypothetical protein